jgi:hypothetical protein
MLQIVGWVPPPLTNNWPANYRPWLRTRSTTPPLADHSAVNGRPLIEASGFPGHTPRGSGAGRPQASGFELQAACFEAVAGVPSTWLPPLPPSMFPGAHWVR